MVTQKAWSCVLAGVLAVGMVPAAAFAAPVGSNTQQDAQPETDGIIITLSDESLALLSGDALTAQNAVEDALAEEGIEVTEKLASLGDEILLAAEVPTGMTDEAAVSAALELPGVEAAQPNYVYELIEDVNDEPVVALEESSPLALLAVGANDPYAQNANSYQSNNQYWLYPTASNSHGAGFTDAWKLVKTNHTVTVVEADSSVLAGHPDLVGNIAVDRVYDGTTGGYKSFADYNPNSKVTSGHGTHVAGIIAGVANNGTGIAGGSYNAQLAPIVLVNDSGQGNSASLINCLNMATALRQANPSANVRVINISAGAYSNSYADTAVKNAIAAARAAGIAVVCAGGNGTGPTLSTPLYPSDLDGVVSVTSLTTTGGNISFSDYNQYKDISAPGQSILSTTADGAYGTKTGTSMASPMVSAAFALLFAAEPNATVDEATAAIYASAGDITYNTSNSTDMLRKAQSGTHGALNAGGAVAQLMCSRAYSDMKNYQWYTYAVGYAKANSIMSGNNGEFRPNGTMTRAEAAQVLYNYLGNGAKVGSQGYSDVPADAWYATAVNWAISKGYITGNAGKFTPSGTLSREMLATIVARVSHDVKGSDIDGASASAYNKFIDRNATSSWAQPSMKWATANGVITGVAQGNLVLLAPQTTITRAQMATIMMRSIDGGLL